MGTKFSTDDIAKIKECPALYVGYVDIRGVFNLVFSFIEEIIFKSDQTNVRIEIHSDDCGSFHISSDFSTGIIDSFSRYVIEALSCYFDFLLEHDSFTIKFKLDRKIFSFDTIEYNSFLIRLTELAQLNNNVTILLANHENRNVIHFQDGLDTMLLGGIYDFGLPPNAKPLSIHFSKNDIEVRVSMIFAYAQDVTLSFVNNCKTHDGGAHVIGLFDGLFNAFREYINSADIQLNKDHPLFFLVEILDGDPYSFDNNPNVIMRDVTENLNFVISLTMDQPRFEGSVRRKLTSESAYYTVKEGVTTNLKAILDSDPSFFYSSRVVQKAELRKITQNHCDKSAN